MPVINPFTQKKHFPQSQETSEPLGMKLGLSLLFKFPSNSRSSLDPLSDQYESYDGQNSLNLIASNMVIPFQLVTDGTL